MRDFMENNEKQNENEKTKPKRTLAMITRDIEREDKKIMKLRKQRNEISVKINTSEENKKALEIEKGVVMGEEFNAMNTEKKDKWLALIFNEIKEEKEARRREREERRVLREEKKKQKEALAQ